MKNKEKKVYIQGRGLMNVSKNILSKIIDIGKEPAQNLLKSALKSGSEHVGNKVGNLIADKLVPDSKENIKAIEELENRIKLDIENYSNKKVGTGFKRI